MSDFRCSNAAADRGELTLGTASRVRRWFLIEAPGPWGQRSLPQNRAIDDELLMDLRQLGRDHNARTLTIRRPSRPRSKVTNQELPTVFVAESTPGSEWIAARSPADYAELLSSGLPFETGLGKGWVSRERVIAVCTHGSHDVCCAVRGRPVAAALAASFPDETWEISHIGGDRFAANAVVLPHGHYLGQLSAASAVEAVTTLAAGQRPDPHYRGRSYWPSHIQVALQLAAEARGITSLDRLVPTSADQIGDRSFHVVLNDTFTGEEVAVDVEQTMGPERARLTCHGQEALVPAWRLG